MNEVTKSGLNLTLSLFSGLLQENNLVIGILVDKKNPEESKLVFVDAAQAIKGNYKCGATVKTEELNKWVNENGNPN